MRLAALFGAALGATLLFLPVSALAALPVAPPVDSGTFAPGVTSLNHSQPNIAAPRIIRAQVSGSIHFGRSHPRHWHGASWRNPHWCRYRWRGRCYPFRHRGVHFRHRRWDGRRWRYW